MGMLHCIFGSEKIFFIRIIQVSSTKSMQNAIEIRVNIWTFQLSRTVWIIQNFILFQTKQTTITRRNVQRINNCGCLYSFGTFIRRASSSYQFLFACWLFQKPKINVRYFFLFIIRLRFFFVIDTFFFLVCIAQYPVSQCDVLRNLFKVLVVFHTVLNCPLLRMKTDEEKERKTKKTKQKNCS